MRVGPHTSGAAGDEKRANKKTDKTIKVKRGANGQRPPQTKLFANATVVSKTGRMTAGSVHGVNYMHEGMEKPPTMDSATKVSSKSSSDEPKDQAKLDQGEILEADQGSGQHPRAKKKGQTSFDWPSVFKRLGVCVCA